MLAPATIVTGLVGSAAASAQPRQAAVAPLARAAGAAADPVKFGTVSLSPQSGTLTGTLVLTPTSGAGAQPCDLGAESYAVVYAAIPGDEYGVAADTLNSTVLAATDASLVPADGSTALDSSTNGLVSLGVRCQDAQSTQIFQNYWTTITIAHGSWTIGGTVPSNSSPTSSRGHTNSSSTSDMTQTTDTTQTTATTSNTNTGPTASGTLEVDPRSGDLLSGSHTLQAVPASDGGNQSCGEGQTFGVLYFAKSGREFAAEGPDAVVKDRPLQAAGSDFPVGGTLVDFLCAIGPVDSGQSLGAQESWKQSVPAGDYSLGVRCQSGKADSPNIHQNYFSSVVVADGSWRLQTPGRSSAPTIPATTAPVTGLVDAAGRTLNGPVRLTSGAPVFLSASGFFSTERVSVVMRSGATPLGSAVCVDGGIALRIVIPQGTVPDTHTLTVTGASSARRATLTVTVVAASRIAPATTSATPRTRSTVPGTASTLTTPTTFGTATTPLVASPAAAPRPPQPLAYTEFAAEPLLTLDAVTIGFGLAILLLSPGASAPLPHRGSHR